MLLSSREVEKLFNISRATLHRWRRQREFPEPIQISPNTPAYDTARIETWLRSRPGATPETRLELEKALGVLDEETGQLGRLPRRQAKAPAEAQQ